MRTGTSFQGSPQARARRVAYRTRGYALGPITRLVSPSDVGELIKPFVFLDYFYIEPKRPPAFGFHPHSGIATLTLVLEGRISYEETSGTKGIIEPGGVEWMRAAGGVWHTGGVAGTASAKGYQLWIALPPEMESIESEAQYLAAEHFQAHGPARVILGRHGEAASKVPAPSTINYLEVALKKGERWRYQPPENHTVAWVAVHQGSSQARRSWTRVSWPCSKSRMRVCNSKPLKIPASSSVQPSSTPTTWCSAPTRFTPAQRRSRPAKPRSGASAIDCARKGDFRKVSNSNRLPRRVRNRHVIQQHQGYRDTRHRSLVVFLSCIRGGCLNTRHWDASECAVDLCAVPLRQHTCGP